MTKAMESRGYDGDLTLYSRVKRPPVRDLVVVAALLGMVIAYEILIQWQVIA
jgi:cobalt/nickel transport system permease protein